MSEEADVVIFDGKFYNPRERAVFAKGLPFGTKRFESILSPRVSLYKPHIPSQLVVES